ncbi:hypothetical protein THIOSC15_1500013 [uncultured Thiomicrorhabdus sp.]
MFGYRQDKKKIVFALEKIIIEAMLWVVKRFIRLVKQINRN